MRKKIFAISLLIILFVASSDRIFAQTTNAGFIPGNIWYSIDPFQEGDKIKIYTLIFNPDTRQFSGTIVFFDKEILLGTRDFIVAGKSTKDVSISWTVTVGDHNIFAKIQDAKFLKTNGTYEDVSLVGDRTENSVRTISKKIVPAITTSKAANDGIVDTVAKSAQNVEQKLNDYIPLSVKNSVNDTTNSVDSFRKTTSDTLEIKKTEAQKNINNLNNSKVSSKNNQNSNNIQKPFEYVKLFFYTIIGYIFKYKVPFYGITFILFWLILRYLWRLIF